MGQGQEIPRPRMNGFFSTIYKGLVLKKHVWKPGMLASHTGCGLSLKLKPLRTFSIFLHEYTQCYYYFNELDELGPI